MALERSRVTDQTLPVEVWRSGQPTIAVPVMERTTVGETGDTANVIVHRDMDSVRNRVSPQYAGVAQRLVHRSASPVMWFRLPSSALNFIL